MKIPAACLALLVTLPGAVAPSIFNLSQYANVGKHLGERDASLEQDLASRNTTPHAQGQLGDHLEKRKGGSAGGGHGGGHTSSGGRSSGSGGRAGTAGAAGAGAVAGGVGVAVLGNSLGSHESNGNAHMRSAGVLGTDFGKYTLCLAFAVAVGMGVMV